MEQEHNKQLKEKGKMNFVLLLFSSFFPDTYGYGTINSGRSPRRSIRLFDR
jgi:hypothetical protein